MSPTVRPPGERAPVWLRVVTDEPRSATRSGRAARPTRSDRSRSAVARRPTRGGPARRPRRRALASSRRRLRIGVVVMVLVLLALGVRLTQLQGFAAATYAEQAERQLTREITLPAVRGEITDRNGVTLAQDVDARAVYADPKLIADPAAVARALEPLVGVPATDIEAKVRRDPSARFVYIARGLEPETGDRVKQLGLVGVDVLEERRRIYPNGTLAGNVVGYTRFGERDLLEGNGGIELRYDDVLRGQEGLRRWETDPAGREIPSARSSQRDPVEGSALRLTLDADLQWKAQTEIAAAVAETGSDSGTIVIMDPRTGDILAMADAPDFDPNNVGQANLQALGNRATGQAFEPGSVNKVITMAAALDRGLITATTPVTVPADIRRGGFTIRDAEPHGTLELTAAGVLAHSSNIGTVLISEKVGPAALEETMRAFGLGRPTELGFPGETGGMLASASDWSASQAATIAYGQGMTATALQMTSVYATIANGGVRMPPRLVAAIGDPDADGALADVPLAEGTRVVSESTARAVSDMLEAVATDQGTAPGAAVPGYRVAGKTGTAYRVDPSCHCYRGYVSSFIGFAPADNPRLVVGVVLDNPKKQYFGGLAAAPVFQKVMTFALGTLGVAPAGSAPPRIPLTVATPPPASGEATGQPAAGGPPA
ncbi:MAG: penicillin-binding protein 2 [Frankia sp.]|nr:penicillin-binding protein 2 [Frankia sp.]